MSDPSGFLATKVASMIGGLLGGAAILTFIRPKSIGEAFTRGGVSVGSALIFGVPVLGWIDMPVTWESQLMSGFCIGFVAYSLLGMVANFLEKNQNKDIAQVAAELKNFDKKKED